MKKNYLLLIASCLFVNSIVFSQTLLEDDFESYEEGNFLGNDGWVREGGEDDWVQIVNFGGEQGKAMQLATPMDNDSGIFVTHDYDWLNREEGNDVLAVNFDFYTGQPSEGIGMIVVGTENFEEIVTVIMAPGGEDLALFAGEWETILLENPTPETWYKISITYNFVDGEVRVKIGDNPVLIGAGSPLRDPAILDFTSLMESSIGIDNVTVTAVNESVLNTPDFGIAANQTTVFPNPFFSEINLHSTAQITGISVYDLMGRKIQELGNLKQVDMAAFSAGSYILKITYENGTLETHKVIKK